MLPNIEIWCLIDCHELRNIDFKKIRGNRETQILSFFKYRQRALVNQTTPLHSIDPTTTSQFLVYLYQRPKTKDQASPYLLLHGGRLARAAQMVHEAVRVDEALA